MKTFVLTSLLALLVGNTYSRMVIHDQPLLNKNKLEVNIKSTNPKTNTSKDGSLEIHILGGTPPYQTQVMGTSYPATIFDKDHFKINHITEGTFMIFIQDSQKEVYQKTIAITVQ